MLQLSIYSLWLVPFMCFNQVPSLDGIPGIQSNTIEVDIFHQTGPINPAIFGEGIDMSNFALAFVADPKYFPITDEMGFKQIRFGGACQDYDWSRGVGPKSERIQEQRYLFGPDEWREYSIKLTDKEPTYCINPNLSAASAVEWVQHTINSGFNIINWEIGNEVYLHGFSPTGYADKAVEICNAMKVQKPDLKCGLVLHETNGAWNQAVCDIAGATCDFGILHFYQPFAFEKNLYWYTNQSKSYEFTVPESGFYSITMTVWGSRCPDHEPELTITLNNNTIYSNDVTNNIPQRIIIDDLVLLAGIDYTLTIEFSGDYAEPGCDVNFFAKDNIKIKNMATGIIQEIPFYDSFEFTKSFYACDLDIERQLKKVRTEVGGLPIYITEFGHHYGSTYWHTGEYYDWRANLFFAMEYLTFIENDVVFANIWSDIGTEHWAYVNKAATMKYPPFYVVNLLSEHTGSEKLQTNIINPTTFDTQGLQNPGLYDVPHLKALSSIKTSHEIYIAVVNKNIELDTPGVIKLNDGIPIESIEVYELKGDTLKSHPYLDGIEIMPNTFSFHQPTNPFPYTFPKFSLTIFKIYLPIH